MDATKVIVTANEAGQVIVRSENNPEWGHIRVEQTLLVVDDSGFAKKSRRSALIPGLIEDLSEFGYTAGQEISGQVIIKESLTPFNKKNPKRDLKIAGDSGVVCSQDGMPIYRKSVFTTDSSKEDDTLSHTNDEEIKAVYAAKGEASKLEPNKSFEL
jgi:hypothetical protein